MPVMAKKKKTEADRMPQFQLRMHLDLLEALLELAERNRTSTTEEARRSIRERLERENLWPRKPKH
jgi:transcription elongation GreA/GreB family factor